MYVCDAGPQRYLFRDLPGSVYENTPEVRYGVSVVGGGSHAVGTCWVDERRRGHRPCGDGGRDGGGGGGVHGNGSDEGAAWWPW